jgi:ABC-2 type transport system permease protein
VSPATSRAASRLRGIAPRRVKAVVLQNAYSVRHSPLRIMELLYWPLLEVVLWGYVSRYLQRQNADVLGGATTLIGAVVLWDVLFRSQQELSQTFLFDMWDRNVLNLFASPLRQVEYFLGGLVFSIARVLVGSVFLVVAARVVFGYDFLSAGVIVPPALLILTGMGWALGLFIRSLIMRFGSNAEVLAWSIVFLLQPISAVFYPVSVLPGWMQAVSKAVPASHVFEALRTYRATGGVLAGRLVLAGVLDLALLAVAAAVAARSYRIAREKGLLGKLGY